MHKHTGYSNLKKYIIDSLDINLDKRLEIYIYHDICKAEKLVTNGQNIDIISHQLELKFESNKPVFISWSTVDGWHQYSLCASNISFCEGVERFTKQDANWEAIVGSTLKSIKIFGYSENIITYTDSMTGNMAKEAYFLEPHLLILEFEHDKVCGVANFYSEDDFEPKLPMGDDIWIIFGLACVERFIKSMSLERLPF